MPDDFEGRILLQIRREFSKNEKYRLFLRHLDNTEAALAVERKKYTELLKAGPAGQQEIVLLRAQVAELQEQLGCYKGSEGQKKHQYVPLKTHNKAIKKSKEFQDMYWELHHKYQELEAQYKELETKLKQNDTSY